MSLPISVCLEWKPAGPCDPGALARSADKRLVHLAAISSPAEETPLPSYQEYLAEVRTDVRLLITHNAMATIYPG